MPRARAIAIQNTPSGGPRRIGEWWAAEGLDLEVIHGYDGDEVPTSADGYDAVVVLGGGYMPDEDDRAPWLAPARSLVESALETDTPVLGICLGGQMLAHVTGGVVRADAGAPEVGSTPITLRSEAADDAVFGGLPSTVTAVENHIDVIEKLPSDAVWLASTDRCPYQAFRIGDTAWGLQFHPEAGASDVQRWTPERIAKRGFDPDAVKQTALDDEPASAPVWRQMAQQFAAVVTGR